MSYAFFPGCSLEGTARDFSRSTQAVSRALGLELPELAEWTCCGSTSAHQADPLLAVALPAKNLLAARGNTVAVCCAACYSRLKTANHHIAADAEMRRQVGDVLGADYDGGTEVLHLLEILVRRVGLQKVAGLIRKPLQGLKVVTYYGCLLTRPPEVTRFDDPDDPTLMDDVMKVAGAEVLTWPHKTECCGAGHSITDAAVVKHLSREILTMARAAGAECIVTACPLCQLNLDMRQPDIERANDIQIGLPVFYFTQLLGLALGLDPKELSLRSLVVDPRPLLQARGFEP